MTVNLQFTVSGLLRLTNTRLHIVGLAINPSKMGKSELRQAVEKHAKDIRVWIRQAPFGATYAPRPQASGYPTPSFSQNAPSRHKATDATHR